NKQKLIGLLLVLIVAAGVVWFQFIKGASPHVRALVFSKTTGYRHESIPDAQAALRKMADEKGFEIVFTEKSEDFNQPNLSKFNVVVFLMTTGEILNASQQQEFNRWVQAGGGFVGIHSAADTEYEWPWYNGLVGAYFLSHPAGTPQATVRREDASHVSTAGLPDEWERIDEWYNYRSIQDDLNVLLSLDESTYEGGENGDNHPIAWYHAYDGGRAWYTGMGHTSESYLDPLFLDHIWGGIRYAVGDRNFVDYERPTVFPEASRFVKVVLDENLDEPMELDFLPSGDILFVERKGGVFRFDRKEQKTYKIHEFDVYTGQEDGLLGLAVSPDFAQDQGVYFFYSPKGDEEKQVISRFALKPDLSGLVEGSEKVIIEVKTQRKECCHAGGSLEFGPGGLLYISTGDDSNPFESDGYDPIDEREGREPFDAQRTSANSNDLRGKILRIKPAPEGGYTIPEGNLFTKAEEGRPEIYVMGCRNPYRISIDNRTGYLYWGDVGPDAGEDGELRGPRGHDEVNQARAAGFFGWPYFVGNNKAYYEYDFAKKQSLELFDAARPVNNSPNNTGTKILPPAQPAYIWYPYAASAEFPMVGTGGRTAMAGPVYHRDDYPENDLRYPAFFDGKLFIYEWMRGWIHVVTMKENGDIERIDPFLPDTEFNNPEDMIFGPEGDIYMLEYGSNWFAKNRDARLIHIKYIAGNRKPVAMVDADRFNGPVSTSIHLSGRASMDHDNDPLSFTWTLAGNVISTREEFDFVFSEAGEQEVKLKVEDGKGEYDERTVTFQIGNTEPMVAWEMDGNQTFYWDKGAIAYRVQVTDAEDGSVGQGIDPAEIMVSIDFLEKGNDINEITLGHQEQLAFVAGRTLIDGSDCKACHQLDQTSIGPTYMAISGRYKNDEGAVARLADKIISGGGGVWGDQAMAAHPQLSQDDAEQIVKYILSVSEKQAPGVPSSGMYVFDQHLGKGNEGKYVFSA
ncbi:MAG: ThuA domain-containing protein, partial [Cyclobacteriaceae bacterium]|nr:ThuA domain-containing protein [Cyclobacteriaceae bacterium]